MLLIEDDGGPAGVNRNFDDERRSQAEPSQVDGKFVT